MALHDRFWTWNHFFLSFIFAHDLLWIFSETCLSFWPLYLNGYFEIFRRGSERLVWVHILSSYKNFSLPSTLSTLKVFRKKFCSQPCCQMCLLELLKNSQVSKWKFSDESIHQNTVLLLLANGNSYPRLNSKNNESNYKFFKTKVWHSV